MGILIQLNPQGEYLDLRNDRIPKNSICHCGINNNDKNYYHCVIIITNSLPLFSLLPQLF
jgi:hypothetical protein